MRRTVTVLILALALAGGAVGLPSPVARAQDDPVGAACEPGAAPIDLPGTELVPEVRTSEDAEPVDYVLWRGTAPSFDGMPLSVDVTVPCGAAPSQPTVVMAHGFTDDKTVWEETDKSDTVGSTDRPGSNAHWNNIWFASRGYVVLNYTARGWRDSCGPDTPGHSVAAPAEQCAPFEFWIHLNDKRWEVRDAQWLAGSLAQSGTSDPERIAITGGSYGGGPATMGALLADKVVCGGAAVPAELGPDPCAGATDGELVGWTTPDGTTPMRWVAALPLYTYGDLLQVLAPNGRASDGWDQAPPAGSPIEPFGVPLEGTVSGLLLAANAYASVPPAGSDPQSDIATSTGRLVAGDPFPADDPEVAQGANLYRGLKSAVTIEPQGEVPIFWVQGTTDALFSAFEPLTILAHLQETYPDYPFKLFVGDIGHDYAAERQDDWDLVKGQMNDFIDHYLRPDRTPQEPTFDVGASVTRCLDPDAPQEYVSAPTWNDLHPDQVTFTDDTVATTSTRDQGPAGVATDPISGATLPGPDSYKGCRIMRPSETDPTTATYEFDVAEDLVLMGGAVVELTVTADAAGIPLAVRLWDVDAQADAQALVARGVYRVEDGAPPDAAEVRFQLTPQAYRVLAGHRLKVEVTGNDSPYLQASSIDADITVERLAITLPLHSPGAAAAGSAGSAAPTGEDGVGDGGTDDGGGVSALWLLLIAAIAGVGAIVWLRRSRASTTP